MEGSLLPKTPASPPPHPRRIESAFDATFAAGMALREKQIQQNYRPVIGIHKWFARRPGTLFRSLILAEFSSEPLQEAYWKPQSLTGLIGDPFMGGGTSLYEASRLGFGVLGCDINPMSFWLVSRAFAPLDITKFSQTAGEVVGGVAKQVGDLFKTRCLGCSELADVKYFLWVKNQTCPHCQADNDLFPGFLLSEAERHPKNVVACRACGELNEYATVPTRERPARCRACREQVAVEGVVKRGKCTCKECGRPFAVPGPNPTVPRHRMWALEYNCSRCYGGLDGRQFKKPDHDDLARHERATRHLAEVEVELSLPDDVIPSGDETDRLHRWGYRRYREMFGARQLLVLGLLRRAILALPPGEVRSALLTVFSDILRYNNMLCRYDTYALKCQDIFSVHGFPVGLVQCENNPLGIPGVGSGGFRHFVEKYQRAKEYCRSPFEVRVSAGKKQVVQMPGETIGADPAEVGTKVVALRCEPAQTVDIAPESLDGVFTDPPYFANVQYAELIDFCYVWLRGCTAEGAGAFDSATTRSAHEATGNSNQGRGIEEFTAALSAVFTRFASGLKAGAPFVFTYHHNDPAAYAPLVVATLDAGLTCSDVLPAAAEMSASLHISGTDSSVLDSVFVCRSQALPVGTTEEGAGGLFGVSLAFQDRLRRDIAAVAAGGVKIGVGDVRCVASGLVAKDAARALAASWHSNLPTAAKLRLAEAQIQAASRAANFGDAVSKVLAATGTRRRHSDQTESDHAPPV